VAVCSGTPQTFVANGVPAGASVTWSVYPTGVASPSQGSATTSLSYQSNGIVSLVATAANSCGSWQGTYQNACGASGTYHIQAKIVNCPNCPAPRRITPQGTVDPDLASDSTSIYPNPASSNIHVHLATGASARSYIKV
jgi:hypothetical protein